MVRPRPGGSRPARLPNGVWSRGSGYDVEIEGHRGGDLAIVEGEELHGPGEPVGGGELDGVGEPQTEVTADLGGAVEAPFVDGHDVERRPVARQQVVETVGLPG